MTPLERAILKALRNPELFSEHIIGRPLRHYQAEPVRHILNSVTQRQGITYTLMFARQMGKNETSAHLEAFLMNRYQRHGGTIIKAAPTLQPQAVNSRLRLLTMLNNPLNRNAWANSDGYITLGNTRALFMSGQPAANVVGLTADLLLEVDEAQDFNEEKYTKDFRPMASAKNATTVMYGTAWTGDTLLEHQIAANQEQEQRDHLRRHFQFDYQTLADINPDYARFVDAERQRLGETHPLFRTQYLLQSIADQAGLFSAAQVAQLHGHHARQSEPTAGKTYVAGLDLAGEDEQTADNAISAAQPQRDAVSVTIAEVDYTAICDTVQEPRLKVVEHYTWTGRKHRDLYPTLVDILRNVWGCTRVVVDATGIGTTIASFLADALGKAVVEQFVFTSPSKSTLAYELLSAVNAGRLKVYTQNAHHDTAATFWQQIRHARYKLHGNQLMSFYVPEDQGHDDMLMSLALCNHAASGLTIAPAAAQVAPQRQYNDGRF
jgi:hypothetical protein